MAKLARTPLRMVPWISLGLTDGESGLVDEIDNGQMKRIAHVDKALEFLGHVIIKGATQKTAGRWPIRPPG